MPSFLSEGFKFAKIFARNQIFVVYLEVLHCFSFYTTFLSDATRSGMAALKIDQDYVDAVQKEVEDIVSVTSGGSSIPPSINDLVIERIRSKLQISEWSMHSSSEVPKCLPSEGLGKIIDFRSESIRTKLREKMLCGPGEDEFDIARDIFEAIAKGKVKEFTKLMNEKVKNWNFQLEEYGNTSPLLWAVLHGQKWIVRAIREHALSKGSTQVMFMTSDKFGFRIMNLAVFAYLIVPKSNHYKVKETFKEILDWERHSNNMLGYMDSQLQKDYTPCKIYHGIEDTPTRYYVDHLGHLGFYMTPLHLATWFAPYHVATQIINWRIKDIERPTGNGHTVFHLSAWKGRRDILQWLVHYTKCNNIPLNIGNFFDNDRQTPLHLAVLSQDKNCVKIFLQTQAIEVTVRNWKGYTPMEIATVLHTSSPYTITKDHLERFGVTSFDVNSLGMSFDVGNAGAKNFTKCKVHSIECQLDSNTLKEIISLFDGLDPEALQRDRQVYVDAANAILVGAALIASASFGAWLQPPLGYTEYYGDEFLVTQSGAPQATYESYVAIKQHWIIQLFWIFNSLSFFFSIATVIAGADAALPKKNLILKDAVRSVRRGVLWASYLLFLSVLCIIGTFTTIGFAILPPISKYRVNMYCTMTIGLAICGIVLIRFLQKLDSSLSLQSQCT